MIVATVDSSARTRSRTRLEKCHANFAATSCISAGEGALHLLIASVKPHSNDKVLKSHFWLCLTVVYLVPMNRELIVSYAAAVIALVHFPASADYTIVLKNGRRFNVENFREESGALKFYGFGGEVSIVKNQVQTIRPAGEANLATEPPKPAAPAFAPENRVPAEKRTTTAPQSPRDTLRSEEKESTKPNVNDEDSYRQLIKKIDDQLKELRNRYATETRGNAGSDPFLFTTEEAFRGHQEDLLSRLRDAQYRAQGLPAGGEAQSPPLSTNPPPAYSEKQKLLSSLRNQLHELESEREGVIAEMKRRDMDTGSLSLE